MLTQVLGTHQEAAAAATSVLPGSLVSQQLKQLVTACGQRSDAVWCC
jgi:hypothetical protein